MKKSNALVMLCLVATLFFSCEKDSDIEIVASPEQELQVNTTTLAAKIFLPEDRRDGTDNKFFWTNFKVGGAAQIDFPLANQYAGNFQLDYQNVGNVVGGKGWSGGSDRTIGYNVGYTYGNFEFVGVYGWTRNTDVEYYVVEKGNGGVIPGQGYQYVSNYNADGKNYNFYKRFVSNAPCALSNQNCNFWQYKSVRQNQPQYISGVNQTISMSTHANEWRKEGLGNYTEYQVFGIEAVDFANFNATGGINATIWEQ